MKPYENVKDLEDQLRQLQDAIVECRRLRWKIVSTPGFMLSEEDQAHFNLFESMLVREIQEIRFHINLEKLLTSK